MEQNHLELWFQAPGKAFQFSEVWLAVSHSATDKHHSAGDFSPGAGICSNCAKMEIPKSLYYVCQNVHFSQ